MKRFDDSTKKLIKNGAALLTSAVVLIAATIAWFSSSHGAPTTVSHLKGVTPKSLAGVEYYKIDMASDILESMTTGTGSAATCTFTSAAQGYTQPSLGARVIDNAWQRSVAWNISSLMPGVYGSYKMVASGSTALIINEIECKDLLGEDSLSAAQIRTVYENVYLYAVAMHEVETETVDESTGTTTTTRVWMPVKEDSSDPNSADCIVCDSIYNLIDKTGQNWSVTGKQKIVTLDNIDAGSGSTAFLLFIGVPGSSVTSSNPTDLRNDHDALRQIGAQLRFGSVLPFEV